MGKLYVVGTPIGNLGDLSPRAAQVLSEVDFIAAEDTRVTMKLLSHLGIKKPMISYYEHNLREKGEIILSRLLGGESCAIVTDAGMPCISDPGEDLVAICRELTKLHEEVIRTTLPKAAEYYRQVTPKGEFVLVIEGAKPEEHPLSFEDALELARGLIAGGTGISQAAKEASRETGFKKGDLYKALLGE